jgi:hypothetical protein
LSEVLFSIVYEILINAFGIAVVMGWREVCIVWDVLISGGERGERQARALAVTLIDRHEL